MQTKSIPSKSLLASACLVFLSLGCGSSDTKIETITDIVIQEPPPPISHPITVNVNASLVSGDFLFDDQPAPNSVYVRASYSFSPPSLGIQTILGETHDLSYEAMVVNGIYELSYNYIQGDTLPVNSSAFIPQVYSITENQVKNINVETATLRSTFTLNGSPFPASPYDKGVFYLQSVDGGELIELAHSNTSPEIINLLPGTYHVLWDYWQGEIVPRNKMTRVQSNLVISGASVLSLDLVTQSIRVGYTLNGAAFPNTPYQVGEFYLTKSSGAEVFLGKTYESGNIVNLIPGVYDIEYRVFQSGPQVPINKRATLFNDFNVDGPLSFDVETSNLTINLTLNGQAFFNSAYEDGIIELYDSQSESYTWLGRTHQSFNEIQVINGVYDLYYSYEDGNLVPKNYRAPIASDIDINLDRQVDVDVLGLNISGAITLDGEDFPNNQYDAAHILLRGENTQQDIFLFETFAQDENVVVMPGTYDVIYSCQTCNNIPANTDAIIIEDLALSADQQIAIDLESVRIEVFKTLNESSFSGSIYAAGQIYGGLTEQDRVLMGYTNTSLADIVVLPGDYNFWYKAVNTTANLVPINAWALVDQQSINNP
ncbi:hypothetical protein ACUR5C_08115 [Aliikangiella sp. IMCC44653]